MGWMWSPPHDRWGSEIQKVESWNLRKSAILVTKNGEVERLKIFNCMWRKTCFIICFYMDYVVMTCFWTTMSCHLQNKVSSLILHFATGFISPRPFCEVKLESRDPVWNPTTFGGFFESSRDLIPGIVKYHAVWGGGMEETFLFGSFSWSLGNGCGVSNGHAKVYQISAGPLHTARCWVAVVEYWNRVDIPRSKQEDFGSWIYKLRWGVRTVCFKVPYLYYTKTTWWSKWISVLL